MVDITETSIAIFKKVWGHEPRMQTILFLLNRVPQITYPLGERRYNESVDAYGEDTWWAPHNFWREFCHMCAGFLISLPALFLEQRFWACLGVYISFQLKEIFLDLRVDQNWKWNFKNFLDAFCWGLGSLFILGL